jgi:hypothetical protein
MLSLILSALTITNPILDGDTVRTLYQQSNCCPANASCSVTIPDLTTRSSLQYDECDPLAIWFWGNSYIYWNNLMSSRVYRALTETVLGTNYFTTVTFNGASMDYHDFGGYMDHNWPYGFSSKTKYTYAIVHDYSGIARVDQAKYKTRHEQGVERFVRETSARGAKPVLLMTPAYRTGYKYDDAKKPTWWPNGMLNQTSSLYIESGLRHNAFVIPWGLATQNVLDNYPEIDLHALDGTHPSHFGCWLLGAVMHDVLTPYRAADTTYDLEADSSNMDRFVEFGYTHNATVISILNQVASQTVDAFRQAYPTLVPDHSGCPTARRKLQNRKLENRYDEDEN